MIIIHYYDMCIGNTLLDVFEMLLGYTLVLDSIYNIMVQIGEMYRIAYNMRHEM